MVLTYREEIFRVLGPLACWVGGGQLTNQVLLTSIFGIWVFLKRQTMQVFYFDLSNMSPVQGYMIYCHGILQPLPKSKFKSCKTWMKPAFIDDVDSHVEDFSTRLYLAIFDAMHGILRLETFQPHD